MFTMLRAGWFGGLLLCGVAGLRGQITELPETVAPGKFCLEMDALTLTVDREAGGSFTGFGAATTFVTTGLSANWDIQLGAEFFISQKYEEGGFTERSSGIGDVYVRTKWRMFDDPETGTALAVIPYVKIPTNSGGVGNHSVEGGVILPWRTTLAGGFDLSAMAEVDFLRNTDDNGYDVNWYASAALSRSLTKVIGFYAETALAKSSGVAGTQGLLGGGLTWAVSDAITWDVAAYRGLSRSAPDWNYTVRLYLDF